MRTIKFRAWDKKTSEMIYDGTEYELRCLRYTDSRHEFPSKVGVCEFSTLEQQWFDIMQFTGAYDREGNPIYDKDIIEFDAIEWGDNETNIHVVKWDEYEHGWSFGGGTGQSDMGWRTVIGNTYENPEINYISLNI